MAEYIQLVGVPKSIPNEVVIPIPSNVPPIVRRIVYGKLQSALKRNTRVVYQDMNETKIALDLAIQMEKATSLLLGRVGMNPEAVVPFIRQYFTTLESMGEMTKAACKKAGIDYKEPKGLAIARKINTEGQAPADDTESVETESAEKSQPAETESKVKEKQTKAAG